MTNEKILITSALPYANGPLHFGHIAGAYLPADCYARFQRLKRKDVLFICGSDEYGVAITLSAEMAGRTPKEHVDQFHEMNKGLFKQLNILFDHFSRTTSQEHQDPVYAFFLDLLKNGYIEERVTDQLYSVEDDRFLADRYVIGTCPGCGFENARGDECQRCGASYEATDLKNPRSKISNAVLEKKATKHWFLLLDRFKERLSEWVETKSWKPNVTNFVKAYIRGLRPRAITRDSNWGLPVPLPDAEGKVLYVWFDAPIGYISATKEWAKLKGEPDRWKDYWLDSSTKLVQFIGKDNIPFHAAVFPAMIMGQDLPYKLVDDLPANEFYNLEGRQFSKSDGWYIDLEMFFQDYTADQIRYAIVSNAPETQDSEFTWHDFQARCNAELLGKYGNLVNRVLVFAHKQCGGRMPRLMKREAVDDAFLQILEKLTSELADAYDNYKLRKASQLIMEIAQKGNVYFDAKQPWKDAKSEQTKERMETTIALCLFCLKKLAIASFPVIPSTAESLWSMLGESSGLACVNWDKEMTKAPEEGQQLQKPKILFTKIEDEQIQKECDKLKRAAEKMAARELQDTKKKPMIEFSDFEKVDLCVGLVTAAEPLPKSKKLLKLTVDVGEEERTVVSGIKEHYDADDIVGKKVVLVVNLKPVKIMGVESQGMILAGSDSDQLAVLQVDKLKPGTRIS